MTRIAPAALAALLLAPTAAAASCVVLDAERDNLAPDQQKAAKVLVEDALRDHGQPIGDAPCDDPWTVHHTQLGSSITARLTHGKHSDKLAVAGIEELPAAYDRLVRALLNGGSAIENADRKTVTSSEEEPRRVKAESLATLRVGWGVIPVSGDTGPALGGGTRFELDRFGIDLAFDAIIPTESPFLAGQGRIGGLFFASPSASATPYAGLGLGIGGMATEHDGAFFGATGTVTIGYALLRETSIRLIPQADLVMPFGTTGQDAWAPWGSVTLGVGYEPFRARRRR